MKTRIFPRSMLMWEEIEMITGLARWASLTNIHIMIYRSNQKHTYVQITHKMKQRAVPEPVPYCANSWKRFWYCRCTQRPKNGLVLTATTPSAGTTVRGSPAPSADSCLSKRNRVLQVKSRSQ